MTESNTLKKVDEHIDWVREYMRHQERHTAAICELLGVDMGSAGRMDINLCIYEMITLDELLLRIRNRKLNQLATKLAADNGE